MKKIGCILLGVLSFWMGGCTSALDVIPENSVTFENFFKTEKDVQTSLNALKGAFRETVMVGVGGQNQVLKGVIADKFNYNGLGFRIMYAKNLDPMVIHTPEAQGCMWKLYYNVISHAQVTKEYAERADIPKENINYYKGQASFYEAYTYFFIAQNWGDAVIVKNSNEVGMKARSPWHEVVGFALDRVNDAIEWLPAYKDLPKDATALREIPCKEVAYCLKAFICAWKASLNNEPELFDEAIDAATVVIGNKEVYSLAGTPEEVCTSVLVSANMNETIFEIPLVGYWNEIFGDVFSTVFPFLTYPVKPEALPGDVKYADALMSYETVDKMYPKGDLRRNAYFYNPDLWGVPDSSGTTGGFAYPYKFRVVRTGDRGESLGQFIGLNQNRIVYRLADIILLRAECYARLNQTGPAITDLNRVRARAFAASYPSMSDTHDLRYAIFKEREKELLWECSRYFDVIRNGYWKTEISSAYARLTDKNVEDGALYLPVTQDAQELNPMLLQNKYWLSRW